MKRFLSIILALALVLSLAPMTFATEGELVDYVFNYKVLGLSADVTITNLTAENYANFDTTKSSGVWSGAYRRSAVSYTLREKGIQFIANKNDGSSMTSANLGSNGLALRITVEDGGKFIPTINYSKYYTAGLCHAILVKVDDAVNEWKMAEALTQSNIANILMGTAGPGGYAIELEKNGEKGFDGFDAEAKSNDVFANEDSKSFDEITLEKGDYFLVLGIDRLNSKRYVTDEKSGTVGLTTMAGYSFLLRSFSLERSGETPVDKTHKFVFGSNMLADSTIEAATADGSYFTKDKRLVTIRAHNTGASTGEQHVDEYSDFDISKGTDKWAVSRLGAASLYLYPEYAQFYTYRVRYGNNSVSGGSSSSPNINTRFVFKIDVEHPGTYDIEAEMYNLSSGTEADVYIVETSKVDGSELLKEFAGYDRMTVDFLKTLPIDGRIGNIGADKTTSTDFITTKELKKGEYYIILHTNSNNKGNVNASNGTQLLCIKSITMTESDGSIVNPETPVNAKANVSFATNIDGTIATDSVARGTSVSISAPETDKAGNKFKCWVRGTEANGVWVSSKANDTFKVMTNTYLTAVYEAPAAEGGKVVEFYNENGQYIETVAAVDGKAVFPTTKPSLTGYDFAGWYTDEETELKEGAELSSDVTYAVAKYTAKQVIGTIANDNVKVNGVASTEYKFGAPISGNDNKAKYWLRNGKIVKFGTSYEYLIWDAANIMSSYDTTTAIRPTVVIDTTSVDGAYMIEYDKGNKSIAEVGILFGNSEKITVDSCKYKATSQWNRDHGQFMAKPYGDTSESFARGYLIYNDGGSYKVIYTDAIEIQ